MKDKIQESLKGIMADLYSSAEFNVDDFIKHQGFNECKNQGKLRLEGKDYVVKDGDVMFFRTGA